MNKFSKYTKKQFCRFLSDRIYEVMLKNHMLNDPFWKDLEDEDSIEINYKLKLIDEPHVLNFKRKK